MKRFAAIITTMLFAFALSFSFAYEGAAYADDEFIPVKYNATYGQTEARSMLVTINKYRSGELTDGGEIVPWAYAKNEPVGGVKDYDSYSNLQPLTYDYELEKVAMTRAMEIAIYYSHTRPDGTSCFTALPNYYNAKGENIAAGYLSAADVMEAWMEAAEPYSGQGHRRNILKSTFTHVGIGHVEMNGTHYWIA